MGYQSNTAAIISFSTASAFVTLCLFHLSFIVVQIFYLPVSLTGGKSNTLKNPVAFAAQNENNFVFAGKPEYSLYSSLRL